VTTPTTTVKPSAPAATTTPKPATRKPARRATTPRATAHHHRKAVHRQKPAPRVALPRLPHMTLAQLTAPSSSADAGRARKLAVGGLSLLILALASATLLAFTVRVERRRVAR
jgi:hypothetical protein